MGVLAILIACILSSCCYRLGGLGGFKNAKLIRRLGCSLILAVLVAILRHPTTLLGWGALITTCGLSYGALTTYLDSVFGYDNFWAAGFLCGIAGLPLLVFIPWWIVVARLVINTVGQGLVSKLSGNDWVEELGRGCFFIL